jgi:NitT/TauT family transport system substrate-binding protein
MMNLLGYLPASRASRSDQERRTARRAPTRMRVGLALSLVALLLVAVAGCGGGGSSSGGSTGGGGEEKGEEGGGMTHVDIAEAPSALQTLPIGIAESQGFFKKNGLEVSIDTVNGGAAIIAALQSGSVQFASATASPIVAADDQGAGLQMLTSLSTYPEQIVMTTKKAEEVGITESTPVDKKLEALKGMSVAVTELGGGLQYTLNYALSSVGMTGDEVNAVSVTPYSSQINALRANRVDAIAPSSPYGSLAVSEGIGVMVANIWQGEVESLPTTDPFQVLGVQESYAKDNPEVMEEMRKALGEAFEYIRANPKPSSEEAVKLVEGFTLPLMEEVIGKGESFPSGTSISEEQFEKVLKFSEAAEVEVEGATYEKLVVPPGKN